MKKIRMGKIKVSARPARGMPIPCCRVHKNKRRESIVARKGRFKWKWSEAEE